MGLISDARLWLLGTDFQTKMVIMVAFSEVGGRAGAASGGTNTNLNPKDRTGKKT